MRATRHVSFALLALGSCAMVACTALLGGYDVGGGAGVGTEGGPATEGGPTTEGGGGDVFVPTDAPTDSPLSCPSPTMHCGSSCVNIETDRGNCGACGRSCLGGTCTARTCAPGLLLARMDLDQSALAAIDTDVFFTTTTFDVFQLPLTSLTPLKLATAPGRVYAIAPAALKVHFTTSNGAGTNWDFWGATIGTANSGAARGLSLGGTPVGLVVAGGNLHAQHALGGTPETFQITSCPLGGGACGANFNGAGRPGTKMAAGSGYVFWTDQFGFVYAMPDTVGSRTVIASGEGTPDTPSWDGTTLYWVNGGSSLIRRSPYPAVSATTFQNIGSSADDLLVDATDVYYSQFDGAATTSHLYTIAKNAALGTAPTIIASGDIRKLVQSPVGVFWVEPATGLHAYRKP